MLRTRLILLTSIFVGGCAQSIYPGSSPDLGNKLRVKLVDDEARSAIAILEQEIAGRSVDESLWQRLFSAEGYLRLKQREDYMGGFGEGFAMLAAAGSPDSNAHYESDSASRNQGDRDVANQEANLRLLETFFLDVVEGRVTSPDSVEAVSVWNGSHAEKLPIWSDRLMGRLMTT
jgi:hypothetical protein